MFASEITHRSDVNPNVEFVKARGGTAYLMNENQLPFDDCEFDSVNIDNVLDTHIQVI